MVQSFELVRRAAQTFADPRLQSQLLGEVAQLQLAAGQFDSALQTFSDMPDPIERRIVLLLADFALLPLEKVEMLVRLLESHPQTEQLAGRIALRIAEDSALLALHLVESAFEPFESEQHRYDLLEKVLPNLQPDDWNRVLRFYRTFMPGPFRDWASLALIKHLARQGRYEEAERYANALSFPVRQSWAYWEMSRLVQAGQSELYFRKACQIAGEVEIVANDDEMMELLAIQLRIFGRAAKSAGLLERSEAATAAVSLRMPRYRLQCFLGKVLVELGHVPAIGDYLPIAEMLASLSSNSDRSRVLVWLAEAGWHAGWVQSVEALGLPQRGGLESDRASQLVEVLKRSAADRLELSSTGDPGEDAVRLSGEQFEALYFNPFAEEDCGCY